MLDVLESRFVVAVGGVIGEGQLRELWSRCLVQRDDETGRPPHARRLVVNTDLALSRSLLHRLAFTMTDRAIEDLSGRAVILHAAGLATVDGDVTALVAASGTGKTTAASMLCRSSFGYVTDETVAVFPDLRVPAFPKPLALVDDPARPGDKVHRSPDELGLLDCPAQMRLGRVVLLDRDRQHRGDPALTRVPAADAVMDLVGHTSALTRLPRPLQALAGLATRTAGVWRLTYSEIETATRALVDLVAADTARVGTRFTPLVCEPASVERSPGTLSCAAITDGVDFDDAALLLVGATPVRLGPLARTIWRRAGTGATDRELLDAVVQEHGEHPDAQHVVADATAELLRAGALLRN